MRLLLFLLLLSAFQTLEAQRYYLFAGTYTSSGSKGIYVYGFNAATGKALLLSHTEGVVNPSFLTLSPNGRQVYACTETRTANAGSISAFSFDPSSGKLTFLNKQSSGGDNPVYVAVHPGGKWAVAGNYTGGSLAAFQVRPDGSLAPAAQVVLHSGSSRDKDRQEKPHVHATVFSPDGNHLLVPDLGTDKVVTYRFRATENRPLEEDGLSTATALPGSGPRHLDFHPNRKWVYVAEELSGTVSVYRYRKGVLVRRKRLPAHSDNATGPFSSADIHVAPDGRFLYVSNRGNENNLAVFRVKGNGRKLRLTGFPSTLGTVPRNFIIEPTGRYLLVANQGSNTIVIFERDRKTGRLRPTPGVLSVPEPSCLQMLRYAGE